MEIFTRLKKKNSVSINAFGYKNKEKYPLYVSKIISKSILVYYYKKKKTKSNLKTLTHLCTIILKIAKERIFVVTNIQKVLKKMSTLD